MVFVNINFIMSLIIALSIFCCFEYFFDGKFKTNIILISEKYMHIIGLIVAIPLFITNLISGYILSFILLTFILYYKSCKLTINYNNSKVTLQLPLNFYLNDFNLWDYQYFLNFSIIQKIWNILLLVTKGFINVLLLNINDVLIAFYIKSPKQLNYAEFLNEHFKFQKILFKYKTLNELYIKHVELNDKSIEDLIKQRKLNRTPSNALNSAKRLPWLFTYNIYTNNIKNLIIQNIIILYNFFKTTIIALLLLLIYFVYTIFFFKIQFIKQLAIWFVIGMIYFWLMSGFNFFLKRYQYGKFTSAIQRFWKRTNTYFWLIEGFLILLFFYYYLNSSQEPLYMYDYSALNQEYLISLHTAGTNVILLSLVIYFMYFVLLRVNSNSWTQLNFYLILISVFIFFSFFIETYQFYYVISVFNERFWNFNEEENLWSIEIDNPILRAKHQYLLICLIAKYWHFLFIFLSWVFFLIKSFERRKVTFVLFGANIQNMIILYVLNFACYLQWFKWVYRRFADLPYTWFMTNIDTKLVFRFFMEIKLLIINFFNFNVNIYSYNSIIYKSISLWTVDSLAIWKFL